MFEQVRGAELEELPELLGVAAQGILEAIEALERSAAAIEDALATKAKANATANGCRRSLASVP